MLIIIPAVITPPVIAASASRNLKSRKLAISAPVHAPVPGRGIATKRNSPKLAYFVTFSLFFSTLRSRNSGNHESAFVFYSQLHTGVISHSINGTGSRFPITDTINEGISGISSANATGTAPLSSIIGSIEIISIYT